MPLQCGGNKHFITFSLKFLRKFLLYSDSQISFPQTLQMSTIK